MGEPPAKRGWRGVEGEAKLGGKGLRFEAKRLQSRASDCLVWFCFVFFQFPPPYPQPSPSLISFIVIIINHRPPNRSSGKEGGSWDLGCGGDGGGEKQRCSARENKKTMSSMILPQNGGSLRPYPPFIKLGICGCAAYVGPEHVPLLLISPKLQHETTRMRFATS